MKKRFSSLAEIQKEISAGKLTLPALVDYYLSQADQHKNLNAFLEIYAGEAKAQRTLSCQVLHADEVVPRMKRVRPPAFVAGLERFAAVHQGLAPAVG